MVPAGMLVNLVLPNQSQNLDGGSKWQEAQKLGGGQVMGPLSWLQYRGGSLSGCRPLFFLVLAHFVLWKNSTKDWGKAAGSNGLFLTRGQAGWAGAGDVAGVRVQCNLGQMAGSGGGARTRVHKELGPVVGTGGVAGGGYSIAEGYSRSCSCSRGW